MLTGEASYYADRFVGRQTASGAIFSQDQPYAAMLAVPLGTNVTVVYDDEDAGVSRWTDVTVVDRGPYVAGRIIDLSQSAFQQLVGTLDPGHVPVKVYLP